MWDLQIIWNANDAIELPRTFLSNIKLVSHSSELHSILSLSPFWHNPCLTELEFLLLLLFSPLLDCGLLEGNIWVYLTFESSCPISTKVFIWPKTQVHDIRWCHAYHHKVEDCCYWSQICLQTNTILPTFFLPQLIESMPVWTHCKWSCLFWKLFLLSWLLCDITHLPG